MRKSFFIVCCGLSMVVLFGGCKNKEAETEANVGMYTYRTTSSPNSTWNPTDYQMNADYTIISLTSDALYDFDMNEAKDGWNIVCSLASAFPVDVTERYRGDARYGVPFDAESGYAWMISLRQDAVWDDGTLINADSFEYAFQQYLNPRMKNFRASSYYGDNIPLVHGEEYYEGTTDWQNVGYVKNGEYSFTVILSQPLSYFSFIYGCSSIALLHEGLYEAQKKPAGDLIKSSYNTSLETSASYGPYKVVEYQPDKYIKLAKNESWCGFKDKRNENLYQTTHIYIQYIMAHATELSMFLQGNLDAVGLSSVDMDKYAASDYRQITPQTYTGKLSLNVDKAALKSEESEGINHSILAYSDFRHALSLSIDRHKYVDTVSIGSDPGFGLINYSYISDPEKHERYRDSEPAKRILCEVYDAESIEDITGYNKVSAKRYFQAAYDAAVAAGDIAPTDRVEIDMHMTTDNEGLKRLVAFLQAAIDEATEGTSLEGKVSLKFVIDEKYYQNMKNGKVDAAITLWGGSAYDPYDVSSCYCDPKYLNEYGFDPKEETCSITIHGTTLTKTYYEWCRELTSGIYAAADYDTRNTVLAGIEKNLLQLYIMIPLYYSNSNSLLGQRIVEGSDHYIDPILQYGGFAYRTYTMDDAEWAAYCKKNHYQLKY